MKKQLQELNRWYDNIKEPRRFFVALLLFMPMIFIATMHSYLMLAAFVWCSVLLYIRIGFRY